YGDSCGVSQCASGPNYEVWWAQGEGDNRQTAGTNNNQCYNGKPRYTFEFTNNPIADADGERIDVSVIVSGGDQAWGLTKWRRVTTKSDGSSCGIPSESGTFSRGLVQQIFPTVYAKDD